MHVFSLEREQQWDPRHHVEKILGKVADGDVTVACWEPGQISPKPSRSRPAPSSFIRPAKCTNMRTVPARTMLFRVRYGSDMRAHHCDWRGNKDWTQSAEDAEYYRRHPVKSHL